LDAISAVIWGANRKTFSAENIFYDVGAKIASETPKLKVKNSFQPLNFEL
jgi:hypothetical protein